ncbi:MAG TPA: hypothetical protein VIM82_06210 [Sulfurimonas sp.]|jgi:hypothetical protein
MNEPYFINIQKDILSFKEYLEEHNMTIDKTNKMFLDLILDILEYFGTEDPDKLDELCEYNILTMRKEFENIIYKTSVSEKVEAILLTFFLRIAKEMEIKYQKIENESLAKLYSLINSKDFKLPSYIKSQKVFALDAMPENIRRMLSLK